MVAKYDAFISYSHAADGRLAPAVQTGLQQLARPWHRRRALWVFRDETGLAVSPALWPAIRTALDSSKYFILLASPSAAQSPWVNQEIQHWLSTKDVEQILPVLSDGDWHWDADTGDFDTFASPSVPAALIGAFREEPRHLDLRWARDGDQLDLRHSRFRAAIADLAAPIHGMNKEDLEGEDIRQYRRFRRVRALVVATLCALTLAASILGILASVSAERAEREAERARNEARVATSRQLSTDAKTVAETDLDLALLLGVEAYRTSPTVQALDGLLSVALKEPELSTYLHAHEAAVLSLAFIGNERLISVDSSGRVMDWNMETKKGRQVLDLATDVDTTAISGDGSLLAVAEASDGLGTRNASQVRLVRLSDGVERLLQGHELDISSLAFAPDGQTLYSGDSGGEIKRWDLEMGQEIDSTALPNAVAALSVAPDGKHLAAGDVEGRVVRWDLENGVPEELQRLAAPVRGLAFNADGRQLAFQDSIGNLQVWNEEDRSIRTIRAGDDSRLDERSGYLSAPSVVQFRLDGRMVAASRGSDAELWSLESKPKRQNMAGQDDAVQSLAFSPDGMQLAVGTKRGPVTLWSASDDPELRRVPANQAPAVDTVAVAPSGDRFAAAGCAAGKVEDLGGEGPACRQGSIVVWSRETNGSYTPELLQGDHTDFVRSITFSPDGRFLASGGYDGLVVLWDLENRRHEQIDLTRADPDNTAVDSVLSLAYSGRGGLLGIGRFDGSIILWDVEHRREYVLRLNKPRGVGDINSVEATAFTRDGGTFITGTDDGVVELWDTSTGVARILTVGDGWGIEGIAANPSNSDVYVADANGRIETWDLDTGELTRVSNITGSNGTIAISGDGELLATGTSNGIELWHASSGRRVGPRRLAGGSPTEALAFGGPLAPGSLLANIGDQLLQWDLAPADILDRACGMTNRNMTREEWTSYLGEAPFHDSCP